MAVVAAVAVVVPSVAGAASKLTIELFESVSNPNATFLASGKAVNKRLVCASGTATRNVLSLVNRPDGGIDIELTFVFRCTSGGSFSARVVGDVFPQPNAAGETASGTWRIISGSGKYRGLEGSGKIKSRPGQTEDDVGQSTYTGKVQNALTESRILIQKILYNPPGADTGTNAKLNKEWVQVKNTGKKPISLKDWTLRDKSKKTYIFKNLILRPGKWVRVHTGKRKDTRKHVYWGQKNYIWNNDRDTALLRNSTRRKIDRCAYRSSASGIKSC